MIHLRQFVLKLERADVRMPVVYGSRQRTSRQNFVPVSGEKGRLLWSPNKIQGVWDRSNAVSNPGVSEGHRYCLVVVGGFASGGLNVNDNNYDNHNNGVGAARNFCEVKHPAESQGSVGDGLNPSANHFPNFLHGRLDHNILMIIDSLGIFCQPN